MERISGTTTSRLALLITLAISVAGLYAGRDVLVPLALAILFSFLLAPLVTRLERHIGRISAVLISVFFATAILGCVAYFVGHQLADVAGKLPEYRGNIDKKVHTLKGLFGEAAAMMKDISTDIAGKHNPAAFGDSAPVPVQPVEQPSILQFVQYLLGPLLGPLETLGIVIIFVIFMLIEREALRDRLLRLVGHQDLNVTTQALDDAANRISRYLLLQLVVNCAYGLGITLGLYLIGVPNAPVWGALAAFMRFIPYIGTWLSAVFPLTLSIATTEGFQPLYVFLLYLGLDLVVPTFIEPLLYGSSTGVSALALLVSALFWTFLWGLPGLFLSMPITVCLMVVGRYVPKLSFFDILLNDQQVLDTRERFYQRLLSMNLEEAMDVVEEELKAHSLVSVFENLFMPTLAMAESDRHRGRLDERHDQFIRESVLEIADDIVARALQSDSEIKLGLPQLDGARPQLTSMCLPARNRDDAVAAALVTHLLRVQGLSARAALAFLGPQELEAQLSLDADVVCITALPPAALTHARHLVQRIRDRFPQKALVICPWGSKLSVPEIRERLRCAPSDILVTTFVDLCAAVRQLAASPRPSQPLPQEVAQK